MSLCQKEPMINDEHWSQSNPWFYIVHHCGTNCTMSLSTWGLGSICPDTSLTVTFFPAKVRNCGLFGLFFGGALSVLRLFKLWLHQVVLAMPGSAPTWRWSDDVTLVGAKLHLHHRPRKWSQRDQTSRWRVSGRALSTLHFSHFIWKSLETQSWKTSVIRCEWTLASYLCCLNSESGSITMYFI